MTPDLLQFVNAISSTPTVLLDLNNGSPIYLAENGWSAPPPRLNRASSSSTSRDGTNVSQSAYADRELVIRLGLDTVSQDEAAEAIQALARLLNSDGQWLKYQTAIAPVFFRTKRAEIDALDEFNGQADGFREVTIRIPAEPFAYGLPVSGTATINNDPTAATNPMSYVFPTIQGDVATPVYLSWTAPSLSNRAIVASVAAASVTGAVARVDLTATTAPSATGTYSITDAIDTLMIGGKRRRVANSGTTGSQVAWTGSVSALPGDYRVLVRAKSASANWTLALGGLSVTTTTAYAVPAWVDLGVVRLPAGFPPSTSLRTRTTVSSPVTLTVSTATAAGSIDLDEILFVPAGLDAASDSRLAAIQAANGFGPVIQADSEADVAFCVSGSSFQSLAINGGLPRLSPGRQNLIAFVFSVYRAPFASEDDKTSAVAVSWSYYPRYLYIRPATT